MAIRRPEQAPNYDAFISYSHAADAQLARALQLNLQHFAKPWYRLNSAQIFRDETNLAATPGAWPTIKEALRDSAHLILLASNRAADSKWVRKELAFWLSRGKCEELADFRSADFSVDQASRLFIVLTEGELVWDDDLGDFDWERCTALPRLPEGTFEAEPLWVDLRWATTQPIEALGRDNERFMQAVAKLLAPIKQLDIQILVGQDYAVYRRNLRTAYLAAGILAALAIGLVIATWIAFDLRDEAELKARIADSRRLAIQAKVAADANRTEPALELALASYAVEPTIAAQDALLHAVQVHPGLERVILLPDRTVSALAISRDGKSLFAGDLNGEIHQVVLDTEPIQPQPFANHAAASCNYSSNFHI